MALRYGFFDSEIIGYNEEGLPEFDRAESSDFLAMFIASIVSDGVLANPGDNFQVFAGEGMTVQVRPGFGVVKGRFAYDDEEAVLELTAADNLNRRIDRIILRANYPDRKCEIIVRAGIPSVDPQPPELLRTSGDYYELCLAEISVGANQSVVAQANITDTRADTAVCGWVTQAIQQVDTHSLFLQWQDAYQRFYADSNTEFQDWLDDINRQFGDTVVGALLEQIGDLKISKADQVDLETLREATNSMIEDLQKEINGLEDGKSNKPVVHQIDLPASGWEGDAAPYTNSIPVEGVTPKSIVEIGLRENAAAEQVKACMSGQFVDGGQTEGFITLRAFGRKPDIDIPVVVIVRGEA